MISHLAGSFTFEADAPKPVEITAFHHSENRRYIINLVNFQKELPNIPVEGVRIRLRLGEHMPRQVRMLPDGEPLGFKTQEGTVEFSTPRLETFIMVAVEY
jgi:hypothetical protein